MAIITMDEPTIIYFKFLPISLNHAYYFRAMKKGRTIKIKTKECKNFVDKIHSEVKGLSKYAEKDKLTVEIDFFFPFKKSPKKRDIDNYSKIMLDALSGKVWYDDSQIYELIIRKHDVIDEEFVGTHIQIRKYTQ